MQKITLLLMLMLFTINSFSQRKKSDLLSKNYYLQKSKNKNTAGWILLGGGTAMIVGGAIAFAHNYDYGSYTATDVSGFVLLGGIVADIVSIPFFVSAHKNKERAASMGLTKLLMPYRNNCVFVQPSVTIKIDL